MREKGTPRHDDGVVLPGNSSSKKHNNQTNNRGSDDDNHPQTNNININEVQPSKFGGLPHHLKGFLVVIHK